MEDTSFPGKPWRPGQAAGHLSSSDGVWMVHRELLRRQFKRIVNVISENGAGLFSRNCLRFVRRVCRQVRQEDKTP